MNSECLEAFQRLKLGKKCKYIIFRVSDDLTEIIVDKESKGGDYEDFTEDLPSDQCRWGVFDLEYRIEVEGEPHAKRNKILFVSWFVFTLLSCRAFSFFNKKTTTFFLLSHVLLGLAITGHPIRQRSSRRCWPLPPKKRFGTLSLVSK